MAERTAAFNRLNRIPGFISRGRERIERIVGAFRNFFRDNSSTHKITDEVIVESSGSHRFLPPIQTEETSPNSLLPKITASITPGLLNELFEVAPSDSDTLPGSPIQSGQLELIAEAVANRIRAEAPINPENRSIPRNDIPESLERLDPNLLLKMSRPYRGPNRQVWEESLEGFNFTDKPTKESTLPYLEIDIKSLRRNIIDPDGLASFDRSLAVLEAGSTLKPAE